jgi:hypothetical protein
MERKIHCCGSGMFIPDPGSEFFPSRIRFFSIPDPGSASKNLSIYSILNKKKWFSKLSEIWSGLFILDPDPYFLHIQDLGSRGQKGTGSRIRNTAKITKLHTWFPGAHTGPSPVQWRPLPSVRRPEPPDRPAPTPPTSVVNRADTRTRVASTWTQV